MINNLYLLAKCFSQRTKTSNTFRLLQDGGTKKSTSPIFRKEETMKKVGLLLISLALFSFGFAQLTVWTLEGNPERMERQQAIAAAFEAASGIAVEYVPVDASAMNERATAAFAAGDLPDVIYHSLSNTLPWAEAGILDVEASAEAIEALGAGTFAPAALDLVAMDGMAAAVPVSGWTQLVVYRKDLFDAAGLEAPTNFANISAAVEALHNPPSMYGFVAATDPSQEYMMQVLEEFFLANGVSMVDADGNIDMNNAAVIETLEHYKSLVEASPPGNLYWAQSRELYLAGQAAMIVWSPSLLDELAGLRDSAPVTAYDDPTTGELAGQTGFVTNLAGPSNPDGAGWADFRYFGITADANTDAAIQFVEYAMNDGYLDTLSIVPENMFPVRNGNDSDAEAFINGWKQLDVGVDRKAPPSLVSGMDTGSRWGFPVGQGALASSIYNSRIIAEIAREYFDGERDAATTAALMQLEIEAMQ